MKESTDSSEVLIYCREHQTQRNDVFMARSNHILMEKGGGGNFRYWEIWGRYFWIWRCQNRYEGAKDRGNTVERYLDEFYGLGTVIFHGLLSFHLDFQLQIPVLGLKMAILVQELDIISMRECRNIIVVHTEVRGDASVGDCGFGWTILGVVVLEMQGESSPEWEIWWRCQ